jgi:hypothetical protein
VSISARQKGKYIAQILVPGKKSQKYLGTFSTPEAAGRAYLLAKAEFHVFYSRENI